MAEEFMKFEEKRKTPRFSMAIPLEYKKLLSNSGAKKGSITRDLSVGGTRFITNEFIPYTARMVLDIVLPLPQRSISAVSKIAWIRKLPAGEKYEVGNQFLEMARDDKERLSTYLDELAGSSPAV